MSTLIRPVKFGFSEKATKFEKKSSSCFRQERFAGIYILKKIRNYTKTKVQNGETLPKLKIGIYSKFDQYHSYNIIMYDFIHIIQ